MEETEAEQIARMAAEGNAPEQQQVTAPVDYQKLFEEQRAQMSVMQQQISQSLTTQQQLAQQAMQQQPQNVSAPVDPYAGFEPETAKAIRAVAAGIEAQFNQKFAATNQELQSLKANTAVNQIAQAAGSNANPLVLSYANTLYKNLQSKGVPVTAQEVYDMAYGQAVREGKIKPGATQQQQYGQPPSVIPGGSRQPVARNRPAHFDNLPLKQQAELLSSEPGFHDVEF